MTAPLRSADELVEYFRSQAKPPEQFLIGIEHEKIGLVRSTARALPFDGGGGIEQILARLRDRYGYEPALENGRLIGLSRGKAKISLEPGGQLEFAGSPYARLADVEGELRAHLAELAEV